MCPCTRKERNDEWRAGKGLPFGLPGLGAVCGVARACKVHTLLRAGALHPAPRPGNAIPEISVNRPYLWRLHREKAPHWVAIVGFDGAVFRVLDPMARSGESDGGMSVSLAEFRKIARYGRRRQTAAVIIASKKEVPPCPQNM